MTIAITIKVTDGIVIAADSATTMTGGLTLGNVYNNAEKLFNVPSGSPVGVVMYGLGNIGPDSMGMLIRDLRREFSATPPTKWHVDPQNFTVEDIAEKLKEYLFEERYTPLCDKLGIANEQRTDFGMMVAGYSSGASTPEIWRFIVEAGEAQILKASGADQSTGLAWNGDGEALARLVKGFDPRLPWAMGRQFLINAGNADPQPADIDPVAVEMRALMRAAAEAIEPHILPAWMPIQDAIDLSQFLVNTCAGYSRYTPGYQTIGGPTDIAAITKHGGFKWVKRKHYFDQALNPTK